MGQTDRLTDRRIAALLNATRWRGAQQTATIMVATARIVAAWRFYCVLLVLVASSSREDCIEAPLSSKVFWVHVLLKNVLFCWGTLARPSCKTWFVAPRESTRQTASRSIQLFWFCTAHGREQRTYKLSTNYEYVVKIYAKWQDTSK